jgi:hypothetical protein
MNSRTSRIFVRLTGMLAAVWCGCVAPGQARVPKAQTVNLAGEHSFTHPVPQEPMVPVECPAQLGLDHVESVKLWLTIDPAGTVIAVNPAAEPPQPDLYEAAKKAALAQRWNPAKHDGKPVFTVLQYTYQFRPGMREGSRP